MLQQNHSAQKKKEIVISYKLPQILNSLLEALISLEVIHN